MDLTAMWRAATARATLPHTSVEATTATAPGCAEPLVSQPASAAGPSRQIAINGSVGARKGLQKRLRKRPGLVRHLLRTSDPLTGPVGQLTIVMKIVSIRKS